MDDPGIRCPRCGCRVLRVIYTRPRSGGRIVRSRRCGGCGGRVLTVERAALAQNTPKVTPA